MIGLHSLASWPGSFITTISLFTGPVLCHFSFSILCAPLSIIRELGARLPRRWVQSPSAFAVHEGLSGNAASSFFSRNPESHGIRSGKYPQW